MVSATATARHDGGKPSDLDQQLFHREPAQRAIRGESDDIGQNRAGAGKLSKGAH